VRPAETVPGFPPTEPPSETSTPQNEQSEESEQHDSQDGGVAQRKPGQYDSRVEQILCDRPDIQIVILQAGKNMEGGGSYIAYTIRIGVRQLLPAVGGID